MLIALGQGFPVIAIIGILLLTSILNNNAIMSGGFAIEGERNLGMTPEQAN